jgi:hypothetical protein
VRRRGDGAGTAARAGLAEWDRSIADTYAESFPQWAAGLRDRAAALDAGEVIDRIPGWELSDYVRGVDVNGTYTLTADDHVTETAR